MAADQRTIQATTFTFANPWFQMRIEHDRMNLRRRRPDGIDHAGPTSRSRRPPPSRPSPYPKATSAPMDRCEWPRRRARPRPGSDRRRGDRKAVNEDVEPHETLGVLGSQAAVSGRMEAHDDDAGQSARDQQDPADDVALRARCVERAGERGSGRIRSRRGNRGRGHGLRVFDRGRLRSTVIEGGNVH
jgi:hypothetical protein